MRLPGGLPVIQERICDKGDNNGTGFVYGKPSGNPVVLFSGGDSGEYIFASSGSNWLFFFGSSPLLFMGAGLEKGDTVSWDVYAAYGNFGNRNQWGFQSLWCYSSLLFKVRGYYVGGSGLWRGACLDAVDFYCMVFCDKSSDDHG